ncbi:hypothetical protein [Chitinivibrio alkaliphilus]|uniref:Uncharacterized protein n=1 Tax=Chitinivibrio alkaliphilus ACht1 TaxID=1313304 RepID=U7DBP6_9BACT|nr:hypothetical protein [Chitinivibrio alkaliphilus]ERP39008.1 hypothetical protein CALK_0500 [Chitinivibrio alkaliphilus ACht1]
MYITMIAVAAVLMAMTSLYGEERYYDWIHDQEVGVSQDPSNPIVSDIQIDLQDFDFSQREVDLGTGVEFTFGERGTSLTIPVRYAPLWAPGFSLQSYIPIIFGKEYINDDLEEDTKTGLGDISLRVTYFQILANNLHIGGGIGTMLPTGEDYILGAGTFGFNTNLTIHYPTPQGLLTASAYYSWRLDDDMEYETFKHPSIWSFNQGYKHFIWQGLSVSAVSKVSMLVGRDSWGDDDNFVFWDLSPVMAYETQIPLVNSVYGRAQFPVAESEDWIERDPSFHIGFNSFF